MDDLKKYKDKFARWSDAKREGGRSTGSRQDREEVEGEAPPPPLPGPNSQPPPPLSQPPSSTLDAPIPLSSSDSSLPAPSLLSSESSIQLETTPSNQSEPQPPTPRPASSLPSSSSVLSSQSSSLVSQPAPPLPQPLPSIAPSIPAKVRPPPPTGPPNKHVPFAVPVPDPTPANQMLAKLKDQAKDAQIKFKQELDAHRDAGANAPKTSWYKRFSRSSSSLPAPTTSASPDRSSSMLLTPEPESNNISRGSVSAPRTPTNAAQRQPSTAPVAASSPPRPALTAEESEELARQLEVFQSILDTPEKFGKYLKFLDQRQQQELLFICEVDQLLVRMPSLPGGEVDKCAQKISKIYLHPLSPMAIRSISSEIPRRLEANLRQSEEARSNHDTMLSLAQKNAYIGNSSKNLREGDKASLEEDFALPPPASESATEPLAIVVHLPPSGAAEPIANPPISESEPLPTKPDPQPTAAPDSTTTTDTVATAPTTPPTSATPVTTSTSTTPLTTTTPTINASTPSTAPQPPPSPTAAKFASEASGYVATTMALLKQAKSQVSEALIRQSLRAFIDYESGKTSESGKLESFEFDDVQRDSTCFRSFLLFLVEDHRYRLLLFWKDVQEASLDKLLIRPADVFECTEDIYYSICSSSTSSLSSSMPRSSSATSIPPANTSTFCSSSSAAGAKGRSRGKSSGMPAVAPEVLLSRLRTACDLLEEIYDRYVGRWQLQSQNSDDLPTLCNSYAHADLTTLVPKIKTLVGKLQPTYKKADRLLRFTLWPQFCKSSYYPSLMELRKQKLQSEQNRRNLVSTGSKTANDFRDITRSLVSFLKQQPVTRDSLVLDCRVFDEIEQPCPKSLAKRQMLAHTSNLRLLEYVCVFRCRTSTGPSSNSSRTSSIQLVHRHPATDHDDVKLPEHLADFCFPDDADTSKLCVCGSGMRRKQKTRDVWGFTDLPGEDEPQEQGDETPVDRMFNFVLITLSGQRLYGACLQYSLPPETLDEPLSQEGSSSQRNSASQTSFTGAPSSTPSASSLSVPPPAEGKEHSRSSEGGSEDEELEMSINAFLASPRLPEEPEEPLPEERAVKQVVAICVLSAIPLVQQLREALTTLLPSIYPAATATESPRKSCASPSFSPSLSTTASPFISSVPASSSFSPLAPRAGLAPEALVGTPSFCQLTHCTLPHQDDIFGVQDAALQVPFCDYSLDLLFRALSPNAMMACLEALLMEKKILLISSQLTTLTVVAESLRTLLYPFDWHYLYIPILPLAMFQYLACPTPFLMGIHSCFRDKAAALLGDSAEDVVRVDLDQNSVSAAHSAERLPEVCRRRLMDSIQQLFFQVLQRVDAFSTVTTQEDHPSSVELCTSASPRVRKPDPIQRLTTDVRVSDVMSRSQLLRMEFLKMWAHMLRDYRHFCMHVPDVSEPALLFDHAGFVASKEGSQDNYAPFLKCLMHTSHFPAFLHERSHAKGLTRVNKDAFDRYEATCSRARASKRENGRDPSINDARALQGWAPPPHPKHGRFAKNPKLGSPLLQLLRDGMRQRNLGGLSVSRPERVPSLDLSNVVCTPSPSPDTAHQNTHGGSVAQILAFEDMPGLHQVPDSQHNGSPDSALSHDVSDTLSQSSQAARDNSVSQSAEPVTSSLAPCTQEFLLSIMSASAPEQTVTVELRQEEKTAGDPGNDPAPTKNQEDTPTIKPPLAAIPEISSAVLEPLATLPESAESEASLENEVVVEASLENEVVEASLENEVVVEASLENEVVVEASLENEVVISAVVPVSSTDGDDDELP